MAVRRPPALPKIGISPDTHARITLASAELGVSVYEFTERALKAELARARHQVKVERYHAALREADRINKVIRPTPAEFGLPPDYSVPKPSGFWASRHRAGSWHLCERHLLRAAQIGYVLWAVRCAWFFRQPPIAQG